MIKHVKQALITGVGELYLQNMTEEETTSKAPTYAEEVIVTPSIDKVQMSLELSEKKVFASNLLHTDLSGVQSATITLDALYLPTGFAEEAQGMIKVGGAWAMPVQPKKKPFRMSFPITDSDGNQVIVNFPKCTLSPVDLNGETQRDEINEQIQQYNIVAMAMGYKGDLAQQVVYHKLDLADPENKAKFEGGKVLETGWYDNATLETLGASTVGP